MSAVHTAPQRYWCPRCHRWIEPGHRFQWRLGVPCHEHCIGDETGPPMIVLPHVSPDDATSVGKWVIGHNLPRTEGASDP